MLTITLQMPNHLIKSHRNSFCMVFKSKQNRKKMKIKNEGNTKAP
jgi:hypothetical protein